MFSRDIDKTFGNVNKIQRISDIISRRQLSKLHSLSIAVKRVVEELHQRHARLKYALHGYEINNNRNKAVTYAHVVIFIATYYVCIHK